MYLGRAVEIGSAAEVFGAPLHPYTQALLSATPTVDRNARRERIILKGELPSPLSPPSGCAFSTRCPLAFDRCRVDSPPLETVGGRQVACWRVETDNRAAVAPAR
jgi:dipeptide transport system ATP-binding protein